MIVLKNIVLLFVLLTVSVQLRAIESDSPVVVFSALDETLDLQSEVEILHDPDHSLVFDDVVFGEAKSRFKPVSEIGNSFGFSKSAYWVRFTLGFDGVRDRNILLQLDYPLIDNVTLFLPDGQGGYREKKSGDALPFSMRDVSYRKFLFELPAHNGEVRTYYMRIQSEGSTQIVLSLWTTKGFIEEVDYSNFVLGIYYGVMLLLMIAATAAFFKMKDKLFFYYALYLFSYLIFQLSLNGLSYQYFWPELPWFTSRVTAALVGLVVVTGLLFSGSFLQIWNKKESWIKSLFMLLMSSGLVSMLLSLFGDYSWGVQLASAAGLVFPPVVVAGAISAVLAGYRPARYFLVAWGLFAFCVFITGLLYAGFLPQTFITSYAIQIGSTIEIFLLGYALMDRVNVSRSAKDRAIENANKYISQLYNGLEVLVDERTQQLSESEAHLRTLIQTLPDLVWWKNPEGQYIGCNPKFERYFGASQAEITGKTDYDFVDKETADFFRKKDHEAIAAGIACLNEEEVTYADDGHVELLETIKMPMYGPDKELIGVLGVGRDITERRRSEQALLNTQKMEAIGQLTGGIAHDFNNILAIIIGNLSLLKNQFTDNDTVIRRIETIEKSAGRAADLTKQLLGFSRNKAEQRKVTNINRLVGDMDSLLARSVTPQVEVTQQFSEGLWNTEIDPGDFQDALINLVLNARDAMSGDGKLTLSTENLLVDDDFRELSPELSCGEYVVLSVGDNGEGMTPEQQERIFEPFYTTKEQGKGTGLGLAMVFGFVSRSNGYIKVNSELAIGTTVTIYLPRSHGEEFAVEDVVEKTDKLPHGQEMILVVDDEEALLELTQETLEALGYRVLTAVNGKQALALLDSRPEINMLISDVLMPGGMNGYQLVELALEHRPELKILLASGYTSKTELGEVRSDFSPSLLLKPFRLSELATRVREILDS